MTADITDYHGKITIDLMVSVTIDLVIIDLMTTIIISHDQGHSFSHFDLAKGSSIGHNCQN